MVEVSSSSVDIPQAPGSSSGGVGGPGSTGGKDGGMSTVVGVVDVGVLSSRSKSDRLYRLE